MDLVMFGFLKKLKQAMFKKLCIAILFLAGFFSGHAQSANEVVSRYIEFMGGEKRWKNVHTIVSTGTYNYGGMVFPFTTYQKAPNRYKVVVPLHGKYFEQAFDGEKGWKIDAFKNETKKTILTGREAKALLNEADVELELPFINYGAKGHQIILSGKDTVAGMLCYKVQLIRNDSMIETYFFNTTTYALLKKQALSKNPELDKAMLDIYYSDYRFVN